MKILRVNVVYDHGSTGKTVAGLHAELQRRGHESIVCYGRNPRKTANNVYKISSEFEAKVTSLLNRISGVPYASAFYSTSKLLNLIREEAPDIVHLHCINGNFVNIARLLHFLKDSNVPTVLTLHAEFMYTGGCGYTYECEKWKTGCGQCPQLWYATHSYFFDRTHVAWQRMANAFYGFDRIVITAVSDWVGSRAKLSPFLRDKRIIVIENGIDTQNTFCPTDVSDLIEKHHLVNENVLLHVTADFSIEPGHRKGGIFIIELAKRLIGEDIKFIIVGDKNMRQDLPGNVINVGRVESQQQLAAYYSLASLTILTSKRETFSKICAESLACGTPIVGFKAGGPELISLKDYSKFVDYGDIDALEATVRQWLGKKHLLQHELRETARVHYSSEKMTEAYMDLYASMLAKNT